ncbi:hypothetical protein BH10ACT3_BH10ACT3_04320 [soil metagenome]
MTDDRDSERAEGDDQEAGRPTDAEKKESLPPGSDTQGDEGDIDGNAGWGEPFEDAPAEGRLAQDGANPPQ